MNIIPETQGAVLLSCDGKTGEFKTTPIVAWAYVSGTMVFPLFDIARPSGLGPLDGILRSGVSGDHLQLVTHPHSQRTYTPEDFYALCHKMIDSGEAEEPTGPQALKKIFADDALRFGEESYKTKSFWKLEMARAVFAIEKNEPYPLDKRCEKIQREVYADLKKEGWKSIDPHAFGKKNAAPGEAEEAEEITAEPAEDDGSNLI